MTIWCENCGEKNMTAENVRYPGTNKDGTVNLFDIMEIVNIILDMF